MRTTLTLDADLAVALRRRVRQTGTSWKQVVNDAIRAGLDATEIAPRRKKPARYRTPVHDPGPPAVRGVHGVHALLELAEGDGYR
jgi:hypothetical protein